MSGRMQDKVVVITGGAAGIGEGMVRRFCAEGAKVVIADVDAGAGAQLGAELGAHFVSHDVASEDSWTSLAEYVRDELGRLDALLNNAGIVSNQSIADTSLDSWNHLIGINLTGMMLGCRTAIAIMRDNPGGSGGAIVNTASTTSYLALPGDAAYTTSKAGVIGLTKSVAVYCAREGLNIRVNSLHPGATLTNILRTALDQAPELEQHFNRMSPLARMGSVEEVAAMALFLASDEASFCTGGQYLVEGGTLSEHPGM